MFKLAILPLFFAAASAGGLFSAAPSFYGHSYGYAAPAIAPIATLAHAPLATSYANTYRTVNKGLAIVTPAISYGAPLALGYGGLGGYSGLGHAGYGSLGYGGLGHGGHGYGGIGYSGIGGYLGHGGYGYSSLLHH